MTELCVCGLDHVNVSMQRRGQSHRLGHGPRQLLPEVDIAHNDTVLLMPGIGLLFLNSTTPAKPSALILADFWESTFLTAVIMLDNAWKIHMPCWTGAGA